MLHIMFQGYPLTGSGEAFYYIWAGGPSWSYSFVSTRSYFPLAFI